MGSVKMDDLQTGQVLSGNVYSNEGALVAKAGSIVNEKLKYRLLEFKVTEVDVVGEDKSIFDHKMIIQLQAMDILQKAMRKYVIQMGTSKERKVAARISSLVERTIIAKEVSRTLYNLRAIDNYRFEHTINVCVLCTAYAVLNNFPKEELKTVLLASILHDIGHLLIPKATIEKPGPLRELEKKKMKLHSQLGYKLILSQNFSEEVARVAYEHHERINGTGYPRGLKGKDLSQLSKLLMVADVYDALTSDRTYRRRYTPQEAKEYFMATSGDLFDHDIVKTFFATIPQYPTGSMVLLNTGEVGIVKEQCAWNYSRPEVIIYYGEDKLELKTPKQVKLCEHDNLTKYVVDILT